MKCADCPDLAADRMPAGWAPRPECCADRFADPSVKLARLKPTTLSGIKSLAKGLKRAEGLKHAVALDRAAVQAGFANWTDATRSFAGGE